PADAVPVLIANITADGGIVFGYPPKARPILSEAGWGGFSKLSGVTDQGEPGGPDFLMTAFPGMREVGIETPSSRKMRTGMAKSRGKVLKIAAQLPQDHKHRDAIQGIARELNRIADRQPDQPPLSGPGGMLV